MTDTVLVLEREDRGPVTILTLNRPNKLNALSNDLLAAMMSELDRIELDPGVRVVVITGAGRAFSAGADIKDFQKHIEAGPAQAIAHFMRPGQRLTRRFESSETDYRGSQWVSLRRRLRVGGVHPSGGRREYRHLQQVRD